MDPAAATQLILTAGLLGYTAGLALGALIAWAAWATSSHEHRYHLTRREPRP